MQGCSTFFAVAAPHSTAVKVGSTDDGLSVRGMFFARLNELRAQRISEVLGKVCVQETKHWRA
jgi:hypothetical protein